MSLTSATAMFTDADVGRPLVILPWNGIKRGWRWWLHLGINEAPRMQLLRRWYTIVARVSAVRVAIVQRDAQ